MGTAYKQKKDYKSAKINYEKSLDLNNKLPETHNNFANLYELLDDFEKSIKHFKAAISINPNFFVAHYGLGNVYITLGKFDEAKRYLQTSIQLQPKFYSAHRALSHITKYKKDDKHLNVLKKLYEDNSVEFERKTELAYALGKAYEDIKNFKSSFKLYKAANLIRRKNINFSINKEKEIFKNIKSVFNLSFFNKYKKSGNPDPSGLFILGMPRSGTTLAAQIISSHPEVYGGNELDFLNEIVLKQYPDFFSNFKQEFDIDIFKKLGDEYISKIRGLSKKSLRIIDKNPSNFKLIGLIKLILPNSKIILCKRNPRDNFLSIYKNFFSNTDLNYAYDPKEISEYYSLYYDLISYWKKILPNFIYELDYEKLTQHPTAQIKNLINYCNLEWNNSCLEFYKNKRPVKTASFAQVRKKIYKTSVNSWRNYEKYLKDFFRQLPK